jgi:hypothetical protein
MMTQQTGRAFQITHTDVDLMRLRLSLTPGQRLQAMFAARDVIVGIIRGRLRQQYPDISEAALNLKMLEEIERVQNAKPWPESLSRYSD